MTERKVINRKRKLNTVMILTIVASVLLAGGWYLLYGANIIRELGLLMHAWDNPNFAWQPQGNIGAYLMTLLVLAFIQFGLSAIGIIFSIILRVTKGKRPLFIALYCVVGAYAAVALVCLISLIAFVRGETALFVAIQIAAIVLTTALVAILSYFTTTAFRANKHGEKETVS